MAKSVDTFNFFMKTHIFSKAFHSLLGLLTLTFSKTFKDVLFSTAFILR